VEFLILFFQTLVGWQENEGIGCHRKLNIWICGSFGGFVDMVVVWDV